MVVVAPAGEWVEVEYVVVVGLVKVRDRGGTGKGLGGARGAEEVGRVVEGLGEVVPVDVVAGGAEAKADAGHLGADLDFGDGEAGGWL